MFDERKINMHEIVGTHDVVLITLDTLRFDVAEHAFTHGKLPGLIPRELARHLRASK